MRNNHKLIKLFKALHYVGKMLSSALLVILIMIGIFLLYFVFQTKVLDKKAGLEPKISLYTIISPSMTPNINVYDTVLDIRIDDPTKIKSGDVITFISTSSLTEGKTVTHRVVEVKTVNDKYEYVTKGDWNPTVDSDTAKFDNVIGKVVLRIPQLGRIQFFIASKTGWIFVILIPALSVIIFDIIKVFKVVNTKNSADNIKVEKDYQKVQELNNNKKINETLKKVSTDEYVNNFDKLKDFENDNYL